MDLIFNELSFIPLAENIQQVENRFKTLSDTFKEANTKFGFKKIRFQRNLSVQLVTEELKFAEALSSFSSKDLKRFLLTFQTRPYFDDLTEEETDNYANQGLKRT